MHDSCCVLRELRIKEAPRALPAGIDGLDIRELASAEQRCGFDGLFRVKYPDISGKMADAKVDDIMASGARYSSGWRIWAV